MRKRDQRDYLKGILDLINDINDFIREMSFVEFRRKVGRMDLIIKYDSEADVLVFKVRDGALADEELLDNDVILGYGSDGKIVSIEMLDAELGWNGWRYVSENLTEEKIGERMYEVLAV